MNRLGTPLAFGLCEYQFTHYGFFGRAVNIVHHLHPPHLVGRLEVFVDLGEVGVEPSFTEQGGVPSATVLLEIVEVHLPVFADGLLFGKLYVWNEATRSMMLLPRRHNISAWTISLLSKYHNVNVYKA